MKSYSFQLAEWAQAFTLEDATPRVLADAKLHLLDVIGVMMASYQHQTVQAAKRAIQDSDAGGRGAYPLLDSSETSLAGAAFVNGVASAVLEFDDTHIQTNIHPTGVIASAALPIAQSNGMTGRQLLEAVIPALEILCRLGLVSPVRMHEVGLHPTSVYGVFAAAYAAAKLKGLDVKTMADAVGTSASLSAGSIASFEDGTSTKTLHVGFAASAAIRAVVLAAQGISGPGRVFEGKYGWYASYVQSKPDFRFSALTDDLGEKWHSLDIATKIYPVAYTLIPFIEAALELRKQCTIDPDQIREIRCAIMPRSFHTVCEPVEEKRRPLTSWHGRISIQHTVAEALVLGRFDKNAFAEESLRNPVINALADKVVHVADPIAAADTTRSRAVITIVFNDGQEVSHTIEDMLGTAKNPATEEVYIRKFRSNVDGVISAEAADALIEDVLHLENAANVDLIFSRLRG